LKELGFNNVTCFDDGEQCYTSAKHPANLIVIDYNLGQDNWSGGEFLDEYSRLYKNTKFLFLSSNSDMKIAVNCVRKGAIDYIIKSSAGMERFVKQIKSITHL
jgi:DNA-binding NarL/FixJ family response regulator